MSRHGIMCCLQRQRNRTKHPIEWPLTCMNGGNCLPQRSAAGILTLRTADQGERRHKGGAASDKHHHSACVAALCRHLSAPASVPSPGQNGACAGPTVAPAGS
eukprot:TRINITY_DN9364_c0_g1_i1.p1 TRINITY_DN9364_c0_g1~~TRINITY_DN9364_c0_g1_i1.p1  ORF type:complete len:103 (-),score=6.43 TRINITY_DN9364_c0_g1_i1:227-535(-)